MRGGLNLELVSEGMATCSFPQEFGDSQMLSPLGSTQTCMVYGRLCALPPNPPCQVRTQLLTERRVALKKKSLQ